MVFRVFMVLFVIVFRVFMVFFVMVIRVWMVVTQSLIFIFMILFLMGGLRVRIVWVLRLECIYFICYVITYPFQTQDRLFLMYFILQQISLIFFFINAVLLQYFTFLKFTEKNLEDKMVLLDFSHQSFAP